MNPPRILVVIPARGGSKRLPGKNLMPLAGRSLLARTADFVTAEGFAARTIVSTDDESIAAAARQVGLRVPFMRPAAIADDAATTLAVVEHAVEWEARNEGRPDLVAVLQVTSPFRRPGLLREGIALLADDPAANSVVAMRRLPLPLQWLFTQGAGGAAERLGSTAAPVLMPTGALYITRTQALAQQNSIYSEPILPLLTSELEAVDIDTAEDFALAEAIAATRHSSTAP